MTDETADNPPTDASASETPRGGSANKNDNGDGIHNNGVAGRTDYASWDRRAADLVRDVEAEEEAERARSAEALGHGRHASSQAEAEERRKALEARKAKRVLEGYKRREMGVVQVLTDLLSGAPEHAERGGGGKVATRYVTRDEMDAGRRVVTLGETTGPGHIVLTQDLSNLTSEVPANATLTPKSYDGDAENAVEEDSKSESPPEPPRMRRVHGIIKLNLTDLHDCTVIVRCKIITGTVEIANCSDLTVRIEREATAATVQADLCRNLRVEFHDAPSGKDPSVPNGRGGNSAATTVFWGEDSSDRVFHAGVSDLAVATYRDGYLDLECAADYKTLGAEAAGNATAEEVQFVTSVVDGELVTERVLRTGSAAGGGSGAARAMTAREVEEERRRKEERTKATEGTEGEEGPVKFVEKGGAGAKAPEEGPPLPSSSSPSAAIEEEEDVQEVYTSMTRAEIDAVVRDCEAQKAKGNEAFQAGEYAQAVLLYSLALDRAAELPDEEDVRAALSSSSSSSSTTSSRGAESKPAAKQLFPRHVVLSNRSASFLKLGEHQKALDDAEKAAALDPTYVKAAFRRGLALHAMGRYAEAVPALAEAHKIEPKNRQIKQALQFAEMRLQQEMRRRMEGS